MVSPMCRASVIVLALLAWSSTASATIVSSTIFFSIDTSADGEPPVPPSSELSATLTYSFDDVANTLTLDFNNLSSGILTQLYFSTSENVGIFDLSVLSSTVPGDTMIDPFGAPPGQLDGFGEFGWVLDFATGGVGIAADALELIDGTIVLSVADGLSFADFFVLDGLNNGPAALKFQSLEGFTDEFNSAFGLGSFEGGGGGGGGEPVPEPATLGLLLMGIVGIAARRLRRRTT